VGGMIILKWILNEYVVKVLTGLKRIRILSSKELCEDSNELSVSMIG
jgi:hypothetical protein